MRIPYLVPNFLMATLFAIPAAALECANAVGGTAPATAPEDFGFGAATACGELATTSGDQSTAVGYDAQSSGYQSTALGFSPVSTGEASTALGYYAHAFADNSIALGWAAKSSGINSFSAGFLAITNGESSVAIGYNPETNGDYGLAIGYEARSHATSSIAAGVQAISGGDSSTAVGRQASSAGDFSTALGVYASSIGAHSVALGEDANSEGDYAMALGYDTSAEGHQSMAVGYDASSDGLNSSALGHRAYADMANTVIIGSVPGVNNAATYANVGLGTTAPTQAVDVERSEAAARFQLTSFTATGTEAPQYIQRRARGTRTAPSAVLNGDNLGLFSFRGYNGSVMGGSRATITAQAAGNFTDTSTPTQLIFATTPVGQTVPQQVLVITHDGKVQVKGTNLNVPDYVFEDDYPLMPLDELRSFIKANGHLPGIPSANEVNAGTHDLAGSDMAHLRKIEELTLYTLQQQATIELHQDLNERLERRNAELERRAAEAETRLARIESLLERHVTSQAEQ